MHIKRLDLLGFKSFAGKTGIAFPRGICAVVGPNGCGKSNIVDAIRWVLGEASAHELRGQRMHDVIFAGSSDRTPVNLAEVNLLLDNEAGMAPDPYRQMPEIMVTRRLFRSGESDYFINKTPVRRLDVQLLFMDTGLGQGGYAIIEQGKISQVVEARPEELRELLEEAAGIMRFKTRKKIAVKKMEMTRQNLDRIQDLCLEVARQTKRLAAEAQRARRHRTLRDQVRRLELHLALQEYDQLQQRLHTLEQHLLTVRSEIEVGNRAWREWQGQWSHFESSRDELQAQQQRHGEGVQQLENQLALNRRDQNHLTNQNQQAELRLEKEKQQQRSLEVQLAQGEAESGQVSAEISELTRTLHDQTLRLAALEEELSTSRAQRQAFTARLDELKTETVEVLSRKAQAHNAEVAARRQLQELFRRTERRRQETADLAPKLEVAGQHILELEQQIERLQNQLTGLRETQGRLRLEALEARALWQEVHQEWQRRNDRYRKDHSRLEALQELERRYEWYDQDVRKLLAGISPPTGTNPSVDVLARFIDVNPSSLHAAEAVFGDLLQALVADSYDDLHHLIQELKRHQGARAHFLPLPFWQLTKNPGQFLRPPANGHRPLIQEIKAPDHVQPLLQTLLSRVFLAEDWSSALEQWLDAPFTYTLVTLDGDCLFADGRVLAGSSAAGQSILHKRREIAELEHRCLELQALCSTQEALVDTVKQGQEQLEQDLAAVEQEIQDQEKVLREAERTCLRLQSDRQKWLDKLELLTAENLRDEEDRQFHQETLETNERLQQALSLTETELQTQLSEIGGQLTALQAAVETSEKEYLQGKIALSQGQQRHQQCQKDAARLQKLISDADSRLTTCREQVRQAELTLHQSREQMTALQQQQQELDRDLSTGRQSLQQLEERHRELQSQQRELEGRRDELKRVYRVRQRDEQQWQSELTEVSLQTDFLRRRILEHHRVQLEQWQRDGELELVAQDQLRQQLEDARQRLEKLGEARYGAIEEHEEQKQRQEFLEAQREDLEKTIQDLQHTIQQIQRTSRKRFLEALASVDKSLGEVFPVLFGGGSARLQLLDEEHPLESGVELLVKLPGKRTASMSLLSGGEKALTAMALLFAISMTKPSPFLLLDEVDAPLDDVNVGRFCDLLKSLQQRSQVIIISHNQRTMEIAHQLIGITMDEPGVSRVIPLDLTQRH